MWPQQARRTPSRTYVFTAFDGPLHKVLRWTPFAHTQPKPSQKKRKRDDDLNDLLPDRPPEEGDSYGSLEFNEVLDEEVCVPYAELPVLRRWTKLSRSGVNVRGVPQTAGRLAPSVCIERG